MAPSAMEVLSRSLVRVARVIHFVVESVLVWDARARLSDADRAKILRLHAGGLSKTSLALHFGVSLTTIWLITKRENESDREYCATAVPPGLEVLPLPPDKRAWAKSHRKPKDNYFFRSKLDGFFLLIGIVFHFVPSCILTSDTQPSLEIFAVNGLCLRRNSRIMPSLAAMILGPHLSGPSLLSVVTKTAIPASKISFAHV